MHLSGDKIWTHENKIKSFLFFKAENFFSIFDLIYTSWGSSNLSIIQKCWQLLAFKKMLAGEELNSCHIEINNTKICINITFGHSKERDKDTHSFFHIQTCLRNSSLLKSCLLFPLSLNSLLSTTDYHTQNH